MTIKQFNGTYYPNEDRILFQFNTLENAEYRFWLTRRITLFILGATAHLMTQKLENYYSSSAAKVITDFKKEVARESIKEDQADCSNQVYEGGAEHPLGIDPVLIFDARCSFLSSNNGKQSDDVLVLDFILASQANVNLKISGLTLSSMYGLLDQLRDKAKWGLPHGLLQPETSDLPNNTKKNIQIH